MLLLLLLLLLSMLPAVVAAAIAVSLAVILLDIGRCTICNLVVKAPNDRVTVQTQTKPKGKITIT